MIIDFIIYKNKIMFAMVNLLFFVSRYRIPDAGFVIRDTRCGIRDGRCMIWDVGFVIRDS
jgi:hypothetical protein